MKVKRKVISSIRHPQPVLGFLTSGSCPLTVQFGGREGRQGPRFPSWLFYLILLKILIYYQFEGVGICMAFLSDITLGQFYPGESFLHRLDPRTKILTSLILMTCLLLTQRIGLIVVEAILCCIAVQLSQIPYMVIARNLKWFFWLFLITFAVHALDVGLTGSWPFFALSVSERGWLLGLVFTVRLSLMIVFASLLTLTTTPMELTDSFERMFAPLKRLRFPVHEFALMMTVALRFIPILLREGERIKNAQLSRGACLDGNLRERVKNIIPMLIPLFVSAIRKADDLAVAMTARHYVGEGRTSYRRLVFRSRDVGVMAFALVFLATSILLKWANYV